MGDDLRISEKSDKNEYNEPDISINHYEPNKIIVAANTIPTSSLLDPTPESDPSQIQFYSTDYGNTWNQSFLKLYNDDVDHSDPTKEWDIGNSDPTVEWTWTSDDGIHGKSIAWTITIGITNVGNILEDGSKKIIKRLRCYRSEDDGETWKYDSTPSGELEYCDKEQMCVDHGISSSKNNMYVIWSSDHEIYVNRRQGPSGTWESPKKVSNSKTRAVGADIKTSKYGDVFAFWPDLGTDLHEGKVKSDAKLYVARSKEGGFDFPDIFEITTTQGRYEIGIPATQYRKAAIYVSGGVYSDVGNDYVYAAWTDLADNDDCKFLAVEAVFNSVTNDKPCEPVKVDKGSPCKTRIWFSRSKNGGKDWSTPQKINDRASNNDQFCPRLAVDDTNGHLAIIYYDTVNDPKRLKTDVWIQFSTDRGDNWSPPTKLTAKQTDETELSADMLNQYGDYIGLTGYSGRFFGCWTDRRDGLKEEIWGGPTVIVPENCVLKDFINNLISKNTSTDSDTDRENGSPPLENWLSLVFPTKPQAGHEE